MASRCWLWILAAGLLVSGGCARSLATIDQARDSFVGGDLAGSRDALSQIADRRGRFADAASLDLAIVELAGGDFRSAENRLRLLRDRFDQVPQVAVGGEVASLVTDDTARAFVPAGYEQVMIRAMLSVCSLAGDATDAESYALQANMKQGELLRDAESRDVEDAADRYPLLAFAPYLRGMLREATHSNYDDAETAYRLVSAVRPQFAPAGEDIARASEGTHSRPGHGVLYLIAFVGRGPVLQETVAPTTSTALAIASSVLNAETNAEDTPEGKRVGGPVLPNIAEVKVPTVVIPRIGVATVGIRIGGVPVGVSQTITDVGELAIKQNEAEMPWTIARAVVRRVAKEAAVAKVGDSFGLSGSAGSLFHFAAASAWAGSEQADTRCWGLLPREIQVFRVELPAGVHDVLLEPLGIDGHPIGPQTVHRATLVDGRNTYQIAFAPDRHIHLATPMHP